MKAIYRFNFDAGRMGSLDGTFIADTEAVDNLIKSGREVYFGEVLGKHSEISGLIEKSDITLLTTDSAAIKVFEEFNFSSGYNPFDYLDDNDDYEDDYEDEDAE